MTAVEQAAHFITNHRRKTMYVPKRVADLYMADCPSTGAGGSVAGMRKQFWGHTCLVALQGRCAYKVS